MLRTSILQEIIDLGLSKSCFGILENPKIECVNLIKQFSEYSVFYVDEKGRKTFFQEFKEISLAKNYLIDLHKILNGDLPFFNRIDKGESFEETKDIIIANIDNTLITAEKSHDLIVLRNLIQQSKFSNWSIDDKEVISDLLTTKGFSFGREIFEQTFLFTQSVVAG